MTDKKPKTEVKYTLGKLTENCRRCVHYEPEAMAPFLGGCELVQGLIFASDWCELFEKKAKKDGDGSGPSKPGA